MSKKSKENLILKRVTKKKREKIISD